MKIKVNVAVATPITRNDSSHAFIQQIKKGDHYSNVYHKMVEEGDYNRYPNGERLVFDFVEMEVDTDDCEVISK